MVYVKKIKQDTKECEIKPWDLNIPQERERERERERVISLIRNETRHNDTRDHRRF